MMEKKTIFLQKVLAILLAVFCCVIAFSQKNNEAKILFHQGLHLEEAMGELVEAIAVYKQVVEQFPEERETTAKAHLHMGICYEKLGKREAQKAYQLIIREFADQQEVVAEAQARLAALEKHPVPAAAKGLSVRRVWTPQRGFARSVSPDGRYLIFRGAGYVGVHDLVTGKSRRLAAGNSLTNVELSPDVKQVAYIHGLPRFDELRLIGLEASEPRVLYQTEIGDRLSDVGGWSPDGKYISAVLAKADGNNYQIVMISVADGSLRILKTADIRIVRLSHFSPDGQYIVYDAALEPNSMHADIFLLTVDGSHEVPLVEHQANDCVIDWTPDGDFLFSSDRTGSSSIWLIRVKEGRPQGAAELIKAGLGGFWPVGFTKQGSFYYQDKNLIQDVYVAALDPQTGKIHSPPVKVSKRFPGQNVTPVWSPDGKSLAYISHQSFHDSLGGFHALLIRSLETGEERIVRLESLSQIFEAGSLISLLGWFPEGRSILARGLYLNREGFFKIDIQSEDISPIIWMEPEEVIRMPALSLDGKTIFYLEGSAKDSPIMALDIETGQKKEIYRPVDLSLSRILNLAVSPDGQKLAFFRHKKLSKNEFSQFLKIIPTKGGEFVERMRLRLIRDKTPPGIKALGGTAWTPDGGRILFWRWKSWKMEDRFSELWSISAEGGEPENLGLAMENVTGLCIHPDGRRIAFHDEHEVFETWVLENFLPKKK
jgi:Tol biopolymer transport system component